MAELSEELKMIKESKIFYPDPEKVKKSVAGSRENFNELLKLSWDNPEKFWDDVARELWWLHPWEKTFEGGLPDFRYYIGGISNPAYNMLDRHLDQGAANRLALIWEGENYETKFYTYRMLWAEVNRFANVLKSFGLKKGDRVAIFLPNLAETVIAVLACYRTGIIFNTVFSGFSEQALRDRLIHYEPQVLITADGGFRRGREIPLKAKADVAIDGITSIQKVIVVKRTNSPVNMVAGRDYWWDDLMATASLDCPPEPIEANEPGLVFYTSGTTGKPKGVVHSGIAFTVNNYIYAKYHLDLHPEDILWCTADIGWLTMHIWGIVGALTNGITTIFFEGAIDYPKPDRFYQIINKYRVSKLFTAPTAVRMLMRYGEQYIKPYDLSCLDVICTVGEPLNPEAWYWMYKHLGQEKIYINNTWGQTETAGTPLAGAAWITPMKPGSCGIQFLGAKLEVIDQEGNPVPPETPGNLIMTRPIPMLVRTLWKEHDLYLKSYFSQVPGAYFTNDGAVKDKDGHFWVIGRIDDVINVAGHRLSTMEMESAIIEVEGVAEVAVVGAPDEIKGLVPIAFVTLRQGYEASTELEEKIKKIVTEKIGKIAEPAKIYFTPVMPKTASGKIMRRLLKELIVKGDVKGDVTSLEDVSSLEKIKEIINGR